MKVVAAFFVAVSLPGICLGKAMSEDPAAKAFEDSVAYRPDAVLDYIKKTEPWKAGRRDILDYGTGNGLLASRLAEAGATSVTAVDISSTAVQTTKKRLEPFPSAMARGTRPSLISPPGTIGYRDRFDTVVSYRGALSGGTTSSRRIQPFTEAMQCAVRATRDNGKVIAVTFGTHNRLKTWLKLAHLVGVGVLAWKYEVFHNMEPWKLNLGIYLSTLPVAGLFDVFFVIAARWVALLKMRLEGPLEISIGFVFVSLLALWTLLRIPIDLRKGYQEGKKSDQVYHNIMAFAGLTDIKATTKVSLFPYEKLEKNNPIVDWIYFFMNSFGYFLDLKIYEGTKKGKGAENLAEIFRAVKRSKENNK